MTTGIFQHHWICMRNGVSYKNYFFKAIILNKTLTYTIISYILLLEVRYYRIIFCKRSEIMTREFIYTKPFLNCWKAMGLNNDHLKILERILLDNPQIGEVIQGTGGARKMRIQLDGRGKSGGGRVIYLDVFEKEKLYLLFAYPKNVQENLSEEQKAAIRALIDAIKKE